MLTTDELKWVIPKNCMQESFLETVHDISNTENQDRWAILT